MEKIIETCLICGEYMGTFKNEMTVPTGFSERPIFQMFGEWRYFWMFLVKYQRCNEKISSGSSNSCIV